MDADLNRERMKMLGELAELGLALARDLQAAALEAEELDDKARLAEAFHRVGRGVRQSLALHARLERDLESAARDRDADAARRQTAARDRRKAEVKGAVERLIWTEHEGGDALVLKNRLTARLDADAATADFLARDPDALIASLCALLGLPSPPVGERVPRTPTDARPHDAWRPSG